MKFGIIHADGASHQVDLSTEVIREAAKKGAKHPLALLDAKCDTGTENPTARQQIYEQMGMADTSISFKDAMDGAAFKGPETAFASTDDGSVTGRLVTQAFLFDAIESSLRRNDYGLSVIFNRKAAQVDSINATEFTRPLLNFTRPAAGRPRAIAQLSEPTRMVLLTASDRSYAILGESIGLEYSDQVAQKTSLNLVALSMQRQSEEASAERIEDQLYAFYAGDQDVGMAPLSGVANSTIRANQLDATVVTAGTMTQTAWVQWLFRKNRVAKIDTVITDLAGALAIQNRIGRPNVMGDNATSKRIDTLESIINPTWPDQVEIIITQDADWPANTIVGFDSRYGYHVVNSTILNYEGMEQLAIRRSTKMRFDSGSIAFRLYDDAWQVLSLALS